MPWRMRTYLPLAMQKHAKTLPPLQVDRTKDGFTARWASYTAPIFQVTLSPVSGNRSIADAIDSADQCLLRPTFSPLALSV